MGHHLTEHEHPRGSAAIREKRAVRVTVFTPERDVVLMGRVSVCGRELRVRTTDGEQVVRLDDVIEIE